MKHGEEMDLDAAIRTIEKGFSRMNSVYGAVIFDEVAIVELGEDPRLLHYSGPRATVFLDELDTNTRELRQEMAVNPSTPGDFSFSREAGGYDIDAYIRLGGDCCLLCNNTQLSMEDVASRETWIDAQEAFFDTSQRFASDPLELK